MFKAYLDQFQPTMAAKAGRTLSDVAHILRGRPLHKLSSNENALGPSPAALTAIQKVMPRLHEYHFRTDEAIREALLPQFGFGTTLDQLLTTNGGLELIDLSLRGFISPGDEVIYTNPTFHVYPIFVERLGARAVDVPLLAPDYRLDVDGVLARITPRSRMIFLCNPSNPTGTYIDRKTVLELMDHLPAGITVFYDEAYWQFIDAPDFITAAELVSLGYPVIGLRTFSKGYGLPGLRVGYGVTSARIAAYLDKLRRPFCINALSGHGAMAAAADLEHEKRSAALVRHERQRYYTFFEEMGLTYWPSQTNFVLFRSPGDVDQLVDRLLEEAVMVRSGATNAAYGCVRVSIGLPESNDAFFAAMRKVL
jgi:histidinol-phosphate aminotransferase